MLGTFTDERTTVIGATFDLDGEKFDALCGRANLSPLTTVDVTLIDVTEDGPPHGAVRLSDDLGTVTAVIPVSDRLEFSDKSLARVNRNLLHTLRHASQMTTLLGYFEEEFAEGVMALAGPVLESDAYICERSIKETPEAFCLTPKALVLADDPTPKDE